MTYRRINRRTLLRGVAGIGVALPFLEAMRPASIKAQSAAAPLRFGVFFSPCGVIERTSRASGGETDFKIGPALEAIEPYRDDLIFFNGLDGKSSYMQDGNPHDLSMGHMLTGMRLRVNSTGRAGHIINGTAGGPSIDQAIAEAIGGETKLRSLELGVESTTTPLEPIVLRMSYGGPDDPRTPLDDPQQVFTRLFGEGEQGAAQVDNLLEKRRSVLDTVLQDFAAVNQTLGYDDRIRLERHANHIRDIETSAGLQAGGNASEKCSMPQRPEVTAELVDCVINEHSTNMRSKCLTSYPDVGKAQMDLMVLALACDLSRVVSLQWSTAESTVHHSEAGVMAEHHRMSHDINGFSGDLTKVDTWYAEQFAYLLSQMKDINEGERTLLDNTLMFWPNELSEGQSHSRNNLPFVTAGSLGGKVPTGRLLTYNGEPHNKLYASFLNLFGVEASGFGEPDLSGTLTGFV